MNSSSTKIPFLIAGFLALTTFSVTAETNFDGVRNLMMQTAKVSDKGVMMMVSERGQMAADAAYLLSEQLEHNPGYKPLLMVPMESQLKASLKELALSKDELPALIIFNKAGQEVARVIEVASVAEKSSVDKVSADKKSVVANLLS
ncbi:MAG: hypothetical protein ACT4OH_05470 [Methylophilaceae bacterium]